MDRKALNLLGIARRAKCLSLGHDAALESMLAKKAKLCLLAVDASPRLEREFQRVMNDHPVQMIRTPFTIEEIQKALSFKAGVLTVNDDGFKNAILKLYNASKGGESL